LADSATLSKSYSPLFFTLFRRRIPVRYLTLAVADNVSILDSASIVKIKVVNVLDAVVAADYAAVKNVVMRTSDYVGHDYAVLIRYLIVKISDYVGISDFATPVVGRSVSVNDYVVYDYVPSMSPNDILFGSMYANHTISGLSAADVYTLHDSVDIAKMSIVSNDVAVVFDSASAVKL
jgi:hypothetical protein